MKSCFFHLYLVKTPRRALSVSILAAVYILASAPLMPLFTQWLRNHHLLQIFMVTLVVGFLGYLFAYFILHLKITTLKPYFFILLFLSLGLVFMWGQRTLEERIHILEFFVLALLFFKATKFHFRGIFLYMIPLLLTVAIGFMDELWQGLLPNRVYDILDVRDNAIGAWLGIGFAWIRQTYGMDA